MLMALVSSFVLLCMTVQSLPTNLTTLQSTSIAPIITFHVSLNSTSSPLLSPQYERFDIPNTSLALHLSLLEALHADAMHACIQSASVWVGHQRQSASMQQRDFDWKDSAGAVFYVESLSRRLTWEEVNEVLQGLMQSLYDREKYLEASFTIEDREDQQIIGKGGLKKYTPPGALSVQ